MALRRSIDAAAGWVCQVSRPLPPPAPAATAFCNCRAFHRLCLCASRCQGSSLNDGDWQTLIHEPGYCATHGICGRRADGDPLSCPSNTPAQPLNATALQKLQAVCPQLAAEVGGTDYCCTEEQLDQLQAQVRGGVDALLGAHRAAISRLG